MTTAIIVGLVALYAFCGAVFYGMAAAHDEVDRLPEGIMFFFIAFWPIVGVIMVLGTAVTSFNTRYPSVVWFPVNLGKWLYRAPATFKAYRARRKEERELNKQARRDMQDDL